MTGANGESQSVEQAMQYLQEVEKELPETDFAEFLNIIEDFKSNRCHSCSPSFHHPFHLLLARARLVHASLLRRADRPDMRSQHRLCVLAPWSRQRLHFDACV